MEHLANWIILLAVIVMLAGAIAVLVLQNFLAAVAATSVVSLGAAVIFVMLRAPDVALTEAAVGTGLSSVIMALALRRLGLWQVTDPAEAPDAMIGDDTGDSC